LETETEQRIAFHDAFGKLLFEFVKAHTHTEEKVRGSGEGRGAGLIKREKSFYGFLLAGLIFIVGPFCCHQLFGVSCPQIL